MSWRGLAVASALILLSFSVSIAHAQSALGFAGWVEEFKARAAQEGISPAVLDDAFTGVELDEDVIALDQKQPEGKLSFAQYIKNTISKRRIKIGREMLQQYHSELAHISKKYGVQPRYIVALWGIESDYGNRQGDFSVIQSLATLAYEGRRAEFFGNELMAALKIMQNERMTSSELTGSWAGAMGNCQFMPSTYLNFAASADGDKHRDIWNSTPDTFASIANYLHSLGWHPHVKWGMEVALPEGVTLDSESINHAKPLNEWRKHGVKLADGKPLPHSLTPYYAIYVGMPDEGTYLVSDNFKALLQWNRSRYFAASVGMLAEKIGE